MDGFFNNEPPADMEVAVAQSKKKKRKLEKKEDETDDERETKEQTGFFARVPSSGL